VVRSTALQANNSDSAAFGSGHGRGKEKGVLEHDVLGRGRPSWVPSLGRRPETKKETHPPVDRGEEKGIGGEGREGRSCPNQNGTF